MEDHPEIMMWCGKRVEDLTIEELRQAVRYLGKKTLEQSREAIKTHEFYRDIREAERKREEA